MTRMALVAAAEPSPLWYATRGAGLAALLILTASVVLGIGTTLRWEGRRVPRVMTADLHRVVSLLAVTLVLVHIVTTLVDPFAQIPLRDAVIPIGGTYRPVWLGLGVAATDVLLAVAVTSVMRSRIGPRLWRAVHWSAYAVWPLALVHGLGTGSDAQAPWVIGLCVACMAAVGCAAARRVATGRASTLPVRAVASSGAVAFAIGVSAWAVHGPWAAGWARAAGTPTSLLAGPSTPTAIPPAARTEPFEDPLIGTTSGSGAVGSTLAFRDTVDTDITLVVEPPHRGETLPTVTVARGSRTVCSVPATAGAVLYAVCGSTRLQIAMATAGAGAISGTLTTSGPIP